MCDFDTGPNMAALAEVLKIPTQAIADIQQGCDNIWTKAAEDTALTNARARCAVSSTQRLLSLLRDTRIRREQGREARSSISECASHTERIAYRRAAAGEHLRPFDRAKQGDIDDELL